MKKRMATALCFAGILALLVFPIASRAEIADDESAVGGESVPAWSVARLRVIDGSAWVIGPGESDWQEFEGNAPLSSGSRVRIPEGSSAEVVLNGEDRIRLGEGSDLELRDLREDRASLTLHEGAANFLLPDDEFFEPVNVALEDGQIVRFPKAGRYRIVATGADEESTVQVREGEARIKAGDAKYRVRAGEEAYVGDGVTIGRLADSGPIDEQGPPPEMSEVERSVEAPPAVVNELSDYGEWVTVPDYGAVWRPRVAAGWSPYYFGRWVWVASFGWTWISDEPWGWYPYRCGNWVNSPAFGWCWSPYGSFISVSFGSGRHHFRPAGYFPARVRFVREGGNTRWVPLRPGERFTRPAIPRNAQALTSWRQPLPRQTVFVREPARQGAPGWRDVHVDRSNPRPSVRPAPVVRTPRASGPNSFQRPTHEIRRPAVTSPGREGVRTPPGNYRRSPGATPSFRTGPAPERRTMPARPSPARVTPAPEFRTEPRPTPERVTPVVPTPVAPPPVERERIRSPAAPPRSFAPIDRPQGTDQGNRDQRPGRDPEPERGWRGGR